uniref:RRM domain-containing protein n=1 Tax=Rhodnius prolixus TaxID=13249 RepID=T1HVY7_RHOPR
MGEASLNLQTSWMNEMKLMLKSMSEQMSQLATKDDLIKIDEKINYAISGFEKVKEELVVIKAENKQLKEKLADLENKSRRNNLIFRGIPESTDYRKVVHELCGSLLGLTSEVNIVQAFPIGRSRTGRRVVLVEFASYKDVLLIMSSMHKAKNTDILIQQDLSYVTRIRRNNLLFWRRRIMQIIPGARLRLRTDVLILTVNNRTVKFKWDDEDGLITEERGNGLALLAEITGVDFLNLPNEAGSGGSVSGVTTEGTPHLK